MAVTSRLISAGRSDVGRKRLENEDRIFIDPERGIYLVVDGLGGHAAGERAARIAEEIITHAACPPDGHNGKEGAGGLCTGQHGNLRGGIGE